MEEEISAPTSIRSASHYEVDPAEFIRGPSKIEDKQQLSLDSLLPTAPEGLDRRSLDYLGDKIAGKIVALGKLTDKKSSSVPTKQEITASKARNLDELLFEEHEIELLGENDTWLLRCKACYFYFSNPIVSSTISHKPTGNTLATGLKMISKEYEQLCAGNCPERRRMKHRVLKHLGGSSKTHKSAAEYQEQQEAETVKRLL